MLANISKSKIQEALEVLKVVEESWTLITVGGSAGFLNTIGHAWGATGEDTDLRQKDIFFLKVVKEGIEVRTTKVGYRAQTSEQAAARNLLEVPLTNVLRIKKNSVILKHIHGISSGVTYKHGSSEIKLVKELSDKDVHLHQPILVSFLHLTDDVREPLVLLLGTGHPDEEHLVGGEAHS